MHIFPGLCLECGNVRVQPVTLVCVVLAFLLVPHQLRAEDGGDSPVVTTAPKTPRQELQASELTVQGMVSYGNWRIFAAGRDASLYTVALEYDRHSWGYFLKSRVDYVAEILPFALFHGAVVTAPWGQPLTPARQNVPGIGFSPIGMRLMWFSNSKVKPYFTVKGGMIVFSKKVPASQASYQSFTMQQGIGVQTRLNPKFDLRLGLFGDFHFSNAFMVPINPGIDVMNASMGLTYHLDRDRH
jgi:hypothetical protein